MGIGKKRLIQFALLAVAAGEISAASADVLILRATGATASRQYPVGTRVPDDARFTLRAGDSLSILSRGSTRTFRGPGLFSATGQPVGTAATRPQVRTQTGAVRGPGGEEISRPKDIWQLDVTQSGRACVLAGRRPLLWRPSTNRTVQLTITPQAGDPQTLRWNAGQATLEWPAGIPVVDGSSYQINWTGGTSPTRLTARSLTGVAASDLEAVATALATNRCQSQLEVFIAARDADAATDGGGRSGGMPAPR